jgi:hypothetical protein
MRNAACFGLLALILSLPMAAQAQQAQTAEGAQRFLALQVKNGNAQAWFVDAQGRTNPVPGVASDSLVYYLSILEGALSNKSNEKVERTTEKQFKPFAVTEIDSVGADGKPNACLTRISKWAVGDQLVEVKQWSSTVEGVLQDITVEHTETSTYKLPPELASPQWIDWRNVRLNRVLNGTQMIASFKGKNFTANLSFTGETELVDRIEYAMRFLKLSCDDAAATGF